MNETDCLLALNAVKGLSNNRIRSLLARYGSAREVFRLKERALTEDMAIPPNVIRNILEFSQDNFLKTEYNLMDKRRVRAVTYLDGGYPRLLREISDAPTVLYVKGSLPDDDFSMAIVGSRRASYYGISVAEKFARRLADYGLTVVSGMARGIDTAAHRGALNGLGMTIAVLGCGLNFIYPLENRQLMEAIAESGAVVSEFPMVTPPRPYNFPRRNRIISGLASGTIVVEAAERSGALITADFALEQGREVYAVPGKIDQPSSRGVHNLIKQGAKLVTDIEDILADLEPVISAHMADKASASSANLCAPDQSAGLSDDEKFVYQRIQDRPVHIDELISGCGGTVSVMSTLLRLELKQLVKQLPGKLFVR